MRVALLTNFIPPYRVPFFEALARVAGELRVLVSTRMEGNRQWQPDWGSLDVIVQKGITLKRTWRTDSFAEAYEQHIPLDTFLQLRRYRPDLIITGEFGARSLQAVAYARMTNTKVVIWATVSDRIEVTRGGLRKRARAWLLAHADKVIVNGESGARYVRRFGVDDADIVRMPYTTDMTQLMALPLERAPHQEHELLCVGAISQRKGVHLLLDAVNLWAVAHPDRNLVLTFAGSGPLESDLKARTVAPNAVIKWIGAVPYHELPRVFAPHGILMFPSLGDEWGLVVNEALAAGLPVCGSVYSQAVEELIRDGVNGWTFEPTDARAVSAALARALSATPAQLGAMRTAARASVRHLTPEIAANTLIEQLG